uniref:U-actitoxin-Avd8e n=1 Tax=Anemonia viridis TaxID=51769 RepID=TX8E_ANEVI|nr:RecName: Full=U-actitoxin-Avd8e; Short=U-AITX-Avd8e; AltName: Full=Avtx-5; Flags: Precursor [Anemonia viridis]
MASARTLVLLLIGAVLMCQVSADSELLNEILAAHMEEDMPEKRCIDRYRSNICGSVIRPLDCTRRKSRMGRFARTNCKKLCGFC